MSELEQKLEGICFYEQPIFLIDAAEKEEKKVIGSELLLRKTGGENRFPAMLYKEYMRDDASNLVFCTWLVKNIIEIINDNPGIQYSFNLDPQQLLYDSTFEAMKGLIPYCDRVMIEVTESIPSNRDIDQYFNYSVRDQIKRIHEMGFSVAVDDVSSGMNSFNAVREYTQDIDRLKLSLIQLRNVEEGMITVTISLWKALAANTGIDLVIEGTDSLEVSKWLLENGLEKQQGYYFATPRKLK
ncbi:EAL domain-containing protein [Pediococcus pentosaceus]|uniref:EAL domain-containing protein n=1 Tax=Pediococcus pentosaceus TaxID=1255 RepID=UPI00190DE3CB|nr:EAL domain-containing protein [Pediococcus pentosaceus]MBF7124721.1 EAL domain-containing protein [Pediococcus pentosaceus]WPK16560.1 EAL domain-containing protein [Pediococcus pentosaceus]